MSAFYEELMRRLEETDPVREADRPFQDVQPESKPEAKSGTDILNEAATNGLAQVMWNARNIHDTRPTPPDYMHAPILNADQRRAAQGLIDFKTAWQEANKAAELANDPDFQKNTGTDPKEFQALQQRIQAEAGTQANRLRDALSAAGLNMDAYGADVSLDDAQRYLLSNDARARIDALQGKYSQTSDQFYEDQRRNLLRRGYNVWDAEYYAGEATRQFQAEKVAYLSDALQGYGLNGGYLNDLGTRLVGMLGDADSELANYYAKMYQSPAAAQDRSNTLDDKALDQDFEREKLGLQFGYNEQGADSALWRKIAEIVASGKVNLDNSLALSDRNHEHQTDRDEAADRRAREAEDRKRAQAQADLQERIDNINRLYKAGHLTEPEAKDAILNAYEIHRSQTTGKDPTKDQLGYLEKYIAARGKERASLVKQLENILPQDPARKQIEAQIQALDEDVAQVREQYKTLMTPAQEFSGATGDYDKDTPVLKTLWEMAQGDKNTYKQLVTNWLTESGMSGVSITAYMGGLPTFGQ